jgi:hypothetical protein
VRGIYGQAIRDDFLPPQNLSGRFEEGPYDHVSFVISCLVTFQQTSRLASGFSPSFYIFIGITDHP